MCREPQDAPCQTLRNHLLQENLVHSSGAKSCCSHRPIRKIISNWEIRATDNRTQLKMLPNISHIRHHGNEYVHYTQHAEIQTRQNPKANCINPAGGSPTKLVPFQKCSCFEHDVGSRRNLIHQHYSFDTVEPSSPTPRSVLHGYLAIPHVQVHVVAVVEDNGLDHSHSQLTTTKRSQKKKKLLKDKLDNLFRLDFLRLEEKWP